MGARTRVPDDEKQDGEEPAVAGALVQLEDNAGKVIAETLSDSSGDSKPRDSQCGGMQSHPEGTRRRMNESGINSLAVRPVRSRVYATESSNRRTGTITRLLSPLTAKISCPRRHSFATWAEIFLGIWGLIGLFLFAFFPVASNWRLIIITTDVVLVTFLITLLAYDIHKTALIKKDPDLLERIRESIRMYREERDRYAQPCSRDSILAAFPDDCRDFVKYVLDQE